MVPATTLLVTALALLGARVKILVGVGVFSQGAVALEGESGIMVIPTQHFTIGKVKSSFNNRMNNSDL